MCYLFIDGYSADSCGFGVLVRGGELKVFLFHRLGCSPLPRLKRPPVLQD